MCIKLPVQFVPSPSYPLRQRQTYDPSVLVHKAFGSHSFWSSSAHSSLSKFGEKLLTLNIDVNSSVSNPVSANISRGKRGLP